MLNALELNTYTILKIFISVTDFKKHTCVMLAICHDLALHSGFVYAHHVHFLHQSFMFQITCIGKTVFARLDAQSVQPVAAAIAPHRSHSLARQFRCHACRPKESPERGAAQRATYSAIRVSVNETATRRAAASSRAAGK